jgi:acetyl/propionyl-CoA carboxylase alpha subunit
MSARSIHKVLIANRGEIARRIMRTCRQMGIATVAVCSDPDQSAPFAREADELVRLGGSLAAESYLCVEAILAAARKSGADAIHPGYGFLSENAAFARTCQQAGLTFIGPPADVIEAMGSKLEAKRRMQHAGVPLLPTVEVGDQAPQQVLDAARSLSWPVLIKASAGGGGRGMRVARGAAEFPGLVETARREAQAAFGDSTVFVEPYIESSRHVEMQIFGDTQGNVIHLFERECSIQRRHQKIIEESPSPALDAKLRQAMAEAAVRGAREIGYVNAGTFEFLLAPDGKFYFLEVNTRLQVEHPVTECITGLDLVRLQILVAAGEPLPPEAREATMRGHAIEARLYAEDPAQGYLPSAGTLHRLRLPPDAGVRLDSAVDESGVISPYYDSMLAKVIVHAPTRAEAAGRLAHVLARAHVHGLRTNRELLVRTLAHPEFLRGQTDTHFLERHDAAALAAPLGDDSAERLHAAAAALAAQARRRRAAKVLRSVPSGWRNNPSQTQRVRFRGRAGELAVDYQFERGGLRLQVDGHELPHARCEAAGEEQVRLAVDGVQRTYEVHQVGDLCYVDSPLGASELLELPRFPLPQEETPAGSLVAPLPGVVNEVKVKQGDTVAAGDLLLVIDSMKVLHWIAAPLAGRIAEVRVEPGHHVQGGMVMVVIEETS